MKLEFKEVKLLPVCVTELEFKSHLSPKAHFIFVVLDLDLVPADPASGNCEVWAGIWIRRRAPYLVLRRFLSRKPLLPFLGGGAESGPVKTSSTHTQEAPSFEPFWPRSTGQLLRSVSRFWIQEGAVRTAMG